MGGDNKDLVLENAIIEDTHLGLARDGCMFTVGFHVKTSNNIRGYIGYSVGIKNLHLVAKPYMDFVCGVLSTIKVDRWEKLLGNYCRVSYVKPDFGASNFLHWKSIHNIIDEDAVFISEECIQHDR